MGKIKTIIFDYDGTIHRSEKIYVDAFRHIYKQMVQNGDAPERSFKDEDITKWLGYSAVDMWQAFMPELTGEKQKNYALLIGRHMAESIRNKQAVLYDGALETLAALKAQGYHVLYLSNCGHDFMRLHAESFGLDDYFDHMYCTGDYEQKPKYEIFEIIKEEFPGEYMVVGDRFHDMEIAKYHQVYTVGCLYGFGSAGELDVADYKIKDIRELNDILSALS